MDAMSHNPAAGDIGSQLVDMSSQGLSAGVTAAMSVLTGLIPAGGEEVSAQAALAFAQEAATMLAANAAAQEELMRTGTALTDIARMYGDADENAAGALTFSGAAISRPQSVVASAVGAGSLRAGALSGEAAAVARSPLASQLIGAPSSPMASAAASAGSSAMSGAAPLGSGVGGAGAPAAAPAAAGAGKPSLASATGPDEDDRQNAESADAQIGERLT